MGILTEIFQKPLKHNDSNTQNDRKIRNRTGSLCIGNVDKCQKHDSVINDKDDDNIQSNNSESSGSNNIGNNIENNIEYNTENCILKKGPKTPQTMSTQDFTKYENDDEKLVDNEKGENEKHENNEKSENDKNENNEKHENNEKRETKMPPHMLHKPSCSRLQKEHTKKDHRATAVWRSISKTFVGSKDHGIGIREKPIGKKKTVEEQHGNPPVGTCNCCGEGVSNGCYYYYYHHNNKNNNNKNSNKKGEMKELGSNNQYGKYDHSNNKQHGNINQYGYNEYSNNNEYSNQQGRHMGTHNRFGTHNQYVYGEKKSIYDSDSSSPSNAPFPSTPGSSLSSKQIAAFRLLLPIPIRRTIHEGPRGPQLGLKEKQKDIQIPSSLGLTPAAPPQSDQEHEKQTGGKFPTWNEEPSRETSDHKSNIQPFEGIGDANSNLTEHN